MGEKGWGGEGRDRERRDMCTWLIPTSESFCFHATVNDCYGSRTGVEEGNSSIFSNFQMHSIMTCFPMSLSLESVHFPEQAGPLHAPHCLPQGCKQRSQTDFSAQLAVVREKPAFLVRLHSIPLESFSNQLHLTSNFEILLVNHHVESEPY